MKALLLLAGIILGVSAFERDSSEVEESLDAAAAERSPDQARSCKIKASHVMKTAIVAVDSIHVVVTWVSVVDVKWDIYQPV
uniref:U64-Sparatoxin-Hju1c_1 n=1 Tax=Heteropoda jugulans TaxID=1358901 RepID=A0A4Q8KBH2_9ARAC